MNRLAQDALSSLRPAGPLPLKGGDHLPPPSLLCYVAKRAVRRSCISPLRRWRQRHDDDAAAPTILDDIALCLVFFTRLPLPKFDFRDRTLAQAIWAAPLAGVAVAVIGSIAYALAIALGLSRGLSAALALAATMLATGCLHEDGLSDTADGFGGGKTREKKLEIMRDSSIGAYGAVGAHHVHAAALERVVRPRQPGLCVLRPGRRTRRIPGAPACIHASAAPCPRRRPRGRRRYGVLRNRALQALQSASSRCWRSAFPA